MKHLRNSPGHQTEPVKDEEDAGQDMDVSKDNVGGVSEEMGVPNSQTNLISKENDSAEFIKLVSPYLPPYLPPITVALTSLLNSPPHQRTRRPKLRR